MPEPHKHAEIIKKWADGYTIQYKRFDGKWCNSDTPAWLSDTEYRVKPTIISFRNWLYYNPSTERYHVFTAHDRYVTKDTGFIRWLGDWQEVEV